MLFIHTTLCENIFNGSKVTEQTQLSNVYVFFCTSADDAFRIALGRAYRGLTGGFLLLQNFSVAISACPHVCFILVLILISMFLR